MNATALISGGITLSRIRANFTKYSKDVWCCLVSYSTFSHVIVSTAVSQSSKTKIVPVLVILSRCVHNTLIIRPLENICGPSLSVIHLLLIHQLYDRHYDYVIRLCTCVRLTGENYSIKDLKNISQSTWLSSKWIWSMVITD